MIYFPQLSTGCVAQLPLQKSLEYRTVANALPSGKVLRATDSSARRVRWSLNFRGLTDAEWNELLSLFAQVEGRLRNFVFLDPTSNLLRWSEDYTKPVWQVDGGLQKTSGIADPSGGTAAWTLLNVTSIAQRVSQTLQIPGSFTYCFSLFVRSETTTDVTLSASNSDGITVQVEQVASDWRRVQLRSEIPGSTEDVTFALEVGASANVQIYGPQVDAQPGPSVYKQTRSSGGIHANTRFDQDEITLTSHGVNNHETTVQMVSQIED